MSYVSEELAKWSDTNNKDKGHFFFNVSMGSGKTHAIKELIANQFKSVVIASYKDSRIDLGLNQTKEGNITNSEFIYGNNLVLEFTKSSYFSLGLTKEQAIIQANLYGKYLGDILHSTNTLTLIDEADFIWTQAGYSTVPILDGNLHSHFILTAIINGIAEHSLIYSFSANPIFKDGVNVSYVNLNTTTSVRFNSWTNILTNNITKHKVLEYALKDSLKDYKPTLVYSSKYSSKEIKVIGKFAETNKQKCLLVVRQDNVDKERVVNDFDTPILKLEDWCNVRTATEEELLLSNKHYVLIEALNSQLDTITELDIFSEYKYVFINISSSRRVSLPKYNYSSCRVIALTSNVNEHVIQVSGRFRLNPVDILVYLINKPSTVAYKFTGLEGKNTLLSLDPNFNSYTQLEPSVLVLGNLGNLVGKTTIDKRLSIDSFLLTGKTSYKEYLLYCKDNVLIHVSRNTFKCVNINSN